VSIGAFVLVCEHVLPLLIVRRDPERALDLLLPAFDPIARLLRPLTRPLVGVLGARNERDGAAGVEAEGPAASPAAEDTASEGEISEEEGRELLQSVVDFTETIVREVMTPRPDIVAIQADATLTELRSLFREEQYSRMPVYRKECGPRTWSRRASGYPNCSRRCSGARRRWRLSWTSTAARPDS
jgi:CBS domain containing-hemolysin-like protein